MIKSWINFIDIYEAGNQNVLGYPIWNSYYMTNRNVIAKKATLMRNGLQYIYDLHKDNGELYTLQEFNEKYGVIFNKLDYSGLVLSIPSKWKGRSVFKKTQTCQLTCKSIVFIQDHYKCNQAVYKLLNNKIMEQVENTRRKWEAVFNKNEVNWEKIMRISFQCTIETRLRSFQYNILNRSLITNQKLFKWKIVGSPNCTFCQNEVETIEHIMFECNKVKELWQLLVGKLSPCMKLEQDVSNIESIMCGVLCDDNYKLVNHILLITKKYIYNTRCKDTTLNIKELLNMILTCYNIEKQIANGRCNENVMKKFEDKWKPLIANDECILKEM